MENIVTDRFILRKVNKDDNVEIFKILSDIDVNEYLNMDFHVNISDTDKLIEDYLDENKVGNKYPFVIIDKLTNEFLGVFLIKLDLFDDDCFEFTIYIGKEHWGKGIYTEVLPYMVKYSFENIKTGNFRGFVMEKNVASSKVLEKCGFNLEKIFEVPGLDGKIISYLITKEEYENKNIKM